MDQTSFFNTAPYSPITDFIKAEKGTAIFNLSPEITTFINKRSKKLLIACNLNGKTEYRNCPVQTASGRYVCEGLPEDAACTLVSDALTSMLPITTHWDASLCSGAGGYHHGGTDGLGVLDVNLKTNTVFRKLETFDLNPESPYVFDQKYNQFSTLETPEKQNLIPSYERYIGECWSLLKVTDTLAVWLASEVAKSTGYPLIYLTPEQNPENNIPAFQVICNRLVMFRTESPSLAYFLLPPFWTNQPKEKYPVLFSGFYDSNENFFSTFGKKYALILNECIKTAGKPAVAILWNSGGTNACYSMQPSVFSNLNLLFSLSENEYACDSQNITAVGGSRGALTALMAAGNPFNDGSYRIAYAIINNPIVFSGTKRAESLSPTTPLIFAVITEATGYKTAWREDFKDPEHNLSGHELMLNNLIGSRYVSLIDTYFNPASPIFSINMRKLGTKVLLTIGTHDAFTTKDPILHLAENLREEGVPLTLRIAYRFGHSEPDDMLDLAGKLFVDTLSGNPPKFGGVQHFSMPEVLDKIPPIGKRIYPEHFPCFFEAPKILAMNTDAKINIVGPTGADVELIATNETGVITLFSGKLIEKTKLEGNPSYSAFIINADDRFNVGTYIYAFKFRLPGEQNWHELPQQNTPSIDGETIPYLQIIEAYPPVSGMELAMYLSKNYLSWGLSEV